MNEEFTAGSIDADERRRAFIAAWRASRPQDSAKAKDRTPEEIAAEIRTDPPLASNRLLAIMGKDPFYNARWGHGGRSPIDDSLPD